MFKIFDFNILSANPVSAMILLFLSINFLFAYHKKELHFLESDPRVYYVINLC